MSKEDGSGARAVLQNDYSCQFFKNTNTTLKIQLLKEPWMCFPVFDLWFIVSMPSFLAVVMIGGLTYHV